MSTDVGDVLISFAGGAASGGSNTGVGNVGDSGVASGLAASTTATNGPTARVPGWVADRLRRLDLNGGAVANYFQHLHDEGTPRSKTVLAKADKIADALSLDHALLDSLLKDVRLE